MSIYTYSSQESLHKSKLIEACSVCKEKFLKICFLLHKTVILHE